MGKVTLTLLNQLEDRNHYSDSMVLDINDNAEVDDDWGFHSFIPHSALVYDSVKKTQYLKDDILYFRVTVEVADRKPWLED